MNMGMGLAQLASSRSQQHTGWLGGGGSQKLREGRSATEHFTKGPWATLLSGCWTVPPGLNRESTLGFDFLVPCFPEQHKIGWKNTFGGNSTFIYSLKVWEVLTRNRTSWSSQTYSSPCTSQKGPWSSVGVSKVMQVLRLPLKGTLPVLESERLGFKYQGLHLWAMWTGKWPNLSLNFNIYYL